jgi:hypothetical protein
MEASYSFFLSWCFRGPTWTKFSAYLSETDFGSSANNDNEILLMRGNDSTSVSGSASVSIVPGSSSPNNGKFFVPNLLQYFHGNNCY